MLQAFQDSHTVAQRWQLVALSSAIATLYGYYVVKKLPLGMARVVASVPIFALFLTLPTLFNHRTEIMSKTTVLFVTTWLGSFKVLALTLGRGPLASHLTFSQFSVLLLMPIFPKQHASGQKGRLHDDAGTPLQLLLRAVAKTVLLGLVVYLLVAVPLWRPAKHVVYALGMVGFLGLLMDGPASLITHLVGLAIVPTFDQPWLSCSLADFWGRRWNITTSSVLRTLVYDAVVEGSLVKRPDPPPATATITATATTTTKRGDSAHSSAPQGPEEDTHATTTNGHAANGSSSAHPAKHHHHHHHKPRVPEWRRAAGMCATFLASGLAHEYIISMLQDELAGRWRWKWLAYFTLQGPLMVGELQAKRAWRRAGLPVPNVWVARALALPLLVWVGGLLFFTPVELDTDTADRVVEGCRANFMAAAAMLLPKVQQVAAGVGIGGPKEGEL
mmetsp:Transcript_37067/g.93487  ORF Transcript_37067/g.93487 Transcript_37067/m.93487 type:complete len:445 (-) Transcript_37067:547-1881(-)